MSRAFGWWVIVVGIVLSHGVVYAQSSALPDTIAHASAPWVFGGWIAGARKQLIKTRLGRIHDRSLYLISLRAERRVFEDGPIALDYTADFQPVVIATANREYTTRFLCTPGVPCLYAPGARVFVPSLHTAYGVGIVPAGLRARVRIVDPFHIVFGISGGAAYFDRVIPDPDETRFNFTADVNFGVLIRTQAGGLSTGARFHHISNANTGRINPGLNSLLFFLGYER